MKSSIHPAGIQYSGSTIANPFHDHGLDMDNASSQDALAFQFDQGYVVRMPSLPLIKAMYVALPRFLCLCLWTAVSHVMVCIQPLTTKCQDVKASSIFMPINIISIAQPSNEYNVILRTVNQVLSRSQRELAGYRCPIHGIIMT